MEYWLANRLGRVWLRLHKGLQPGLGAAPGECVMVARREPLAAERLWRAQDFAVRVWWRFGMVIFLLIFPLIAVGAATRPGRSGRDVLAALAAGLVCVAAVAMAQAGLLRYRSDRTRLYLLKAGPAAASQPLPPGAGGLPRRLDFWVMLVLALAVFAVLLYAGTRS